jgi:hypothetical protein
VQRRRDGNNSNGDGRRNGDSDGNGGDGQRKSNGDGRRNGNATATVMDSAAVMVGMAVMATEDATASTALVMEGMTDPCRQGTARWLLGSDGRQGTARAQ